MRIGILALTLILPFWTASLRAQVTAAAAADAAAHAKSRQGVEKSLADLERREKQLFLDLARIFRDSDPQGLDFRFIREEGRMRRPRVQADQAEIARLDSTRQVANAQAVVPALRARQLSASVEASRGDSLVVLWKEVLFRAESSYDHFKGEDKPSNSADVKTRIKDLITFYERVVRLSRAAIEFEASLSKSRRAEAAAIEAHLREAPPD